MTELIEPCGLSVAARRTLAPAGREHQHVYRLRSGWCARVRYLRDGGTQVTAILLPGDLVSVRSMLLEVQPEEIATVTACEFDVVSIAKLRKAAASSSLMIRLWWQTLEDERRLHNWLVALGRGCAEERLALLLLDIRGRLALARSIGSNDDEFPWPLTQQDLADILGLTAVHVNRTLQNLRAKGLVEVKSRRARIDVPALHRLAYPLLDIFERNRPEFGAPILAVA
ncbi:Crp/Fnr family transcriptional regulator [Sphingosinicella rhizophila]|uniref:Crp/Fnr family transcriptional regulator n=1 Tax=Sphingosinicella rhizophila TaxID=3050082 RepID=A0ABU3Q7J9_9SPHN|nr:Crp/Fnr family transcriptional regulator [Sphingosinicella sp. GR2756]MDT9599378.1 Crp/Fnr family transcriptional regulator [Sphingosinicella sp. GR2756]